MQTDEGLIIGSPGLDSYYRTEIHCKTVLQESLNENLVCSWNSKAYQIFNATTGLPLGSAMPANYYSQSADCGIATKSQPAGAFFCGWTPQNRFAPFVRNTNLQIGGTKNGWIKLNDCIQGALQRAREQVICSWDGEQPQLYDSTGKSLVNFTEPAECNSFINGLPKNPDQLKQVIEKIASTKSDEFDLNEREESPLPAEATHFVSDTTKPFCLTLAKGLERGCARNSKH